MSFERLPNELLLDIFGYFSGVDLLRTFYGLNFRLNNLLHDRFQDCLFKFNSISKHDFDLICEKHLYQMKDYIPNLHLSDDEQTPTQIKLFLSSLSSFNQLIQLKSLTLSHLRSYKTLIKILDGCENIFQLNFLDCYFQDPQADFQLIINKIWNLPILNHCKLGISIKGQCSFRLPTTISQSLQYLSIEKIQLKLSQINQLFEYTPELHSLSVSISSFNDNDYVPLPLPSLTDLTVSSHFTCNASNIGILLQNLPNLRRLNLDLSPELIEGDQLEQIISTHLPNLDLCRLKMKITLPIGQNLQQRVNNLMNSFRTPFWIDDHRWYVRCFVYDRMIYVYTTSIPYEEKLPISFMSTDIADDERDFYHNLTKIKSETFFDQPISSSIRMTNINDLYINLPINDQFWSIVSNFNQLKRLRIVSRAINPFQAQVQALLNRTINLNQLSITQNEAIPLQNSLFKYTNKSIRQLDLIDINHYFNDKECIALSRSPLGIQCEVLSILVHNRPCIISLIENMPRLRALIVRCKDDRYVELSTVVEDEDAEQDDCMKWLRQHLPSTCVVIRDPKRTCFFLIWN